MSGSEMFRTFKRRSKGCIFSGQPCCKIEKKDAPGSKPRFLTRLEKNKSFEELENILLKNERVGNVPENEFFLNYSKGVVSSKERQKTFSL